MGEENSKNAYEIVSKLVELKTYGLENQFKKYVDELTEEELNELLDFGNLISSFAYGELDRREDRRLFEDRLKTFQKSNL